MRTVYDLVDEYKDFLFANHPERFNSFHQLCCTQPEAARAEAVVFSFFQWNGYNIRVEETPSEGGVDFRVQTAITDFVVEVTSILRATFTEYSGAPEIPIQNYYSDLYKVAHLIRQEAANKASQMSGYNCPRILIIACEHQEYQNLLQYRDQFGANILLTGTPMQEERTGDDATDLADSLFFRFQKGRIVFCRKSISAVLPFFIAKNAAQTVGLLHPKPAYKFLIEFLPLMPFGTVLVPEKMLIPEMEDYSAQDSYKLKTIWIRRNLGNGLFQYNQRC